MTKAVSLKEFSYAYEVFITKQMSKDRLYQSPETKLDTVTEEEEPGNKPAAV
jgi:hypothetical protein